MRPAASPSAIVASLGVGSLAGLFNGLIVTVVGIPSLVVTIGTQFLYRGLAPRALVAGKSTALVATNSSPAYELMVGKVLNIPMEFYWLVLVTIAVWVLLNRHRVGQDSYVIGDNRQAAKLMGVPIRRTRILLFVLTGVAAAFAGLLNSLQVVNFYPSLGAGYLLPTLAAVFIGGTSVFGGRGSVWGTFIGAFMIGGITAGIVAVGLTDFYTNLIYGAVLDRLRLDPRGAAAPLRALRSPRSGARRPLCVGAGSAPRTEGVRVTGGATLPAAFEGLP